MHDVIKEACKIAEKDPRNSTQWNETCREVHKHSPDGAAFSECGSFEYYKDEDDPIEIAALDAHELGIRNSLFNKAIQNILKEANEYSLRLIR
jgi:hypothetical protein